MLKLNKFVDDIIGELQNNSITTIFGPPGSGKTTLMLEYTNACLNQGKKVLYVDTEGGFSIDRLLQINSKVNINDVLVFSPKNFDEQKKIIKDLNLSIKNNKNVGLIIIDSLVMLYRLELESAPQKINSDLARQLQLLTEVSRNYMIPILIVNQMYQNFETKEKKMVGGSIIEYWSKVIVELDRENSIGSFKLRKHKYKGFREIDYEIDNKGLKTL